MASATARIRPYLIAVAALLVIWQGFAAILDTEALPGPFAVLTAFAVSMKGPMAGHFLRSSYRVLISLVLALVTAVPLGIYMGRSSRADAFLSPVVYLVYPVPKIAFLPLILLLLGIGDNSKVFLISFILFFQILVTTRDAAREIPREHILSMRSLGANRWQKAAHLVLPAVLPKVLTSLRISIGTAIAVLFFVESFATNTGLGYFILDAWSRLNYREMYAGIVGMGLLGVILYEVVEFADRTLCRWTKL